MASQRFCTFRGLSRILCGLLRAHLPGYLRQGSLMPKASAILVSVSTDGSPSPRS